MSSLENELTQVINALYSIDSCEDARDIEKIVRNCVDSLEIAIELSSCQMASMELVEIINELLSNDPDYSSIIHQLELLISEI